MFWKSGSDLRKFYCPSKSFVLKNNFISFSNCCTIESWSKFWILVWWSARCLNNVSSMSVRCSTLQLSRLIHALRMIDCSKTLTMEALSAFSSFENSKTEKSFMTRSLKSFCSCFLVERSDGYCCRSSFSNTLGLMRSMDPFSDMLRSSSSERLFSCSETRLTGTDRYLWSVILLSAPFASRIICHYYVMLLLTALRSSVWSLWEGYY